MSYDKLMEKVAEVAPQHHEFLLKTAEEVKNSPFNSEIIDELDGLMKKAFQMPGWAGDAARSAGKSFAGGAGMVGGAVAAGIAYALAGDMYDAAKRGITKTRNYQNMVAANPDLKTMEAKKVQQAFSVLHRFNPEFASDPTVAGAWVKRQATYGEDAFGNSQELGQLISSRKNLSDAKRLPSVPNFDPRDHQRKNDKHPHEVGKLHSEANKIFNEDSRNEEAHKQRMRKATAEAEKAELVNQLYRNNFPTP